MGTKVFRAKYTLVLKALVILYAAPWLFSIPNALIGRSGGDWKLFWLLAGSVWAVSGILHMRCLLVSRVTLGAAVTVEAPLLKPAEIESGSTVQIYGDLVRFKGRDVSTQYLANGRELVRMLEEHARHGRIHLVYEQHDHRGASWTTAKNLAFLMAFALYMLIVVALRLRPLNLVGLATDAFLLGWAALLPVLLAVRLASWVRARLHHKQEFFRENET